MFSAESDNLVHGVDLHIWNNLLDGVNLRVSGLLVVGGQITSVDDDSQIGALLERDLERAQQSLVGKHDDRVGLLERSSETLLSKSVVGSDNGNTLRQRSQAREHPSVGGLGVNVHLLLGLDSEVSKTSSIIMDQLKGLLV